MRQFLDAHVEIFFVFWNYILYAFCDFWNGFYQRLFVIFVMSLLASVDYVHLQRPATYLDSITLDEI
jgi:hypothetical protein